MYNLLISSNEREWLNSRFSSILARKRIFEYTGGHIGGRYRNLTPENRRELCALPALFAYRKSNNWVARLGRIDSIQPRNRGVKIEYSFIPGLPEISARRLFALKEKLDIHELEPQNIKPGEVKHWAVRDVDLRAALIDAGLVSERQFAALREPYRALFPVGQAPESQVPESLANQKFYIQPEVFRIPEGAPDPKLVSVMMPFDAAFDPVFEAVKQAGQDMGLQVSRADQVWKNSEVIQDIFSLIFRSRFVICDFSDKNPNVFYEAGIAHTLGRPVIPVAQNKDDIPFDIGHHRYVIYDNTEQGRDGLIRNIRSRMKDLAQNNAV